MEMMLASIEEEHSCFTSSIEAEESAKEEHEEEVNNIASVLMHLATPDVEQDFGNARL